MSGRQTHKRRAHIGRAHTGRAHWATGVWLVVCALLVVAPVAGLAQGNPGVPLLELNMGSEVGVPKSPLLTIDPDRLYAQSLYGKRLQSNLDQAAQALARENRQIEAELSAEERELTTSRPTLSREDFRALADTFDEKVTALRRRQDAKTIALQRRREVEQNTFLVNALPVLSVIVKEAGAVAIIDRGSVFLTADEIDITDVALRRLDSTLGTGAGLIGTPSGIPPVPRPGGLVEGGLIKP
jgi:Skp family chaperone for outer membrane proteins